MKQRQDENSIEASRRAKAVVAGWHNLSILAVVLGTALLALIFDRLMPPIGPTENLWARGILLAPVFLAGTWFLLNREAMGSRVQIVLLGSVALIGLGLRLHAYFMLRGTPLEPDAQIYRAQALAKSFGHFWDANTVTPVHVYLVRIWYALFGISEPAQRSLTVVLSLLVVLLTFALAERLFGFTGAVIASMLVALSPTLVVSAARGLREEIVILEVLLLLWVLLRPIKNLWTAATAGLLMGLIALTRMELLLPLGLTVLVASFRPRAFNELRLAATGVLAILLVVPQVLLLQKTHGDIFHWTGVFTRGWINIEYASGNLSRDAFERSADRPEHLPSLKEIRKNAFEGPPTSPTTWFFQVHDERIFVERTLLGTVFIPLSATENAVFPRSEVTRSGSGRLPAPVTVVARLVAIVVTVLSTVGIALTVRGRKPEILITLLAAGAVYAFPFTIGGITPTLKPQFFDMRVVEFLMPIMLIGAGGALQYFFGRSAAVGHPPLAPLDPLKAPTE